MRSQNNNGQPTAAQLLSLLNPRQQIDLRQYWFILWRRKWWIILPSFMITCGSIAYALMYIRPIYEASTTLQVAPSRLLNRSVREVIPGASAGADYRELTRKILSTNYLVQLSQRLELVKDEKAMQAARSLQAGRPSLPFNELLERVLVEHLRKNMSVTLIPGSELFQITARHESPQMSYYLSKTLAEIFIDESKRNELRGIRGAMEFSDEQLVIYKSKVDESEQKLKRLKERLASSQIKNVGLTAENLVKLRGLKNSIEIAMTDKQRRLEQLQKTLPSSSLKSFWDAETALSRIQSRIADRMQDFKESASHTIWQDDYEITLNNDINILRQEGQRILMNVIPRLYPWFDDDLQQTMLEYQLGQIDLYILRSRARIADDILSSFAQVATAGPSDQLELQRLEEELEQNRRIYRMFLEQSRGSQIEEALQHTDADFKYSLIEPARVPIYAVGGSKRKFVLWSFLSSLALGVVLVIGLEFFDQTIRSVEDIEEYLQVPVWGVIPKISVPFSVWNATFKKSAELPEGLVSERLVAEGNFSYQDELGASQAKSPALPDSHVNETWNT